MEGAFDRSEEIAITTDTDRHVHDHPIRGRVNAAFFNLMGGYLEWLMRHHKPPVLDGVGGCVVEIGPGVGVNLRHYPPGTELLAVEPNRRMHPHLRRHARVRGVDLRILETGAEQMDELPDDSVDDVISTLVLCTVTDQERTIHEISRILRPGGRFRFVEHVAAPPGSATRRVQDAVKRPWRWVFEGCCVDRPTGQLIEQGPFRSVDYESFRLRSPFVPANPAVAGIAIR